MVMNAQISSFLAGYSVGENILQQKKIRILKFMERNWFASQQFRLAERRK